MPGTPHEFDGRKSRRGAISDWSDYHNGDGALDRYITFDVDPSIDDEIRRSVDWASLLGDDRLREFLVGRHLELRSMNRTKEAVLTASLEMCERLAAEIGAECDVDPG